MTVRFPFTDVIKEPGGRIRVRSGKKEWEFTDAAHLRDFVRSTLDDDVLLAIGLRLWADRSGGLAVNALKGKALVIDTAAASWGTVE